MNTTVNFLQDIPIDTCRMVLAHVAFLFRWGKLLHKILIIKQRHWTLYHVSELEVVIKSEVTKILLSLLGHLQSLLLQLVNHFIGQPRTFPCSGQVKMMDNAPKNHTKMKYKLIINLPPLFFWLHIFINYNLYILFIHYFRYSTIIINI